MCINSLPTTTNRGKSRRNVMVLTEEPTRSTSLVLGSCAQVGVFFRPYGIATNLTRDFFAFPIRPRGSRLSVIVLFLRKRLRFLNLIFGAI